MENFIEIQPGIVFHYEARKSKRHPRIETQTQLFKYVSRCERTSAYLSHERDFFFNSAYTVHVNHSWARINYSLKRGQLWVTDDV